jgi:O-antigen/teichoic acid export membrane protein
MSPGQRPGLSGRLADLVRRDRGAVETAVSNMIVALLVFLGGVVLARALGPEGRGRVAAHLVGVAASFALGSLGVNYGAALAAARSGGSSPVFARIRTFGLLSLFATLVLEFAIEKLVVRVSDPRELAWALAGAASTQATSILLGWIQGCGSLRLWNGLRLVQLGLYCPLLAALWAAGRLSVWTAVAAYTLPQIGTFLVSLAWILPALRETGRADVSGREIWSFSSRVALSAGLYQVNQRWDQLFLSLLHRNAGLGIYASAVTLAGIAVPLATGAAQATYAEGLRMGAAERRALTGRRIGVVVGGAAVCAAFLLAFGGWLMKLIYGPAFAAGALPLAILACGTVFLAGNFVAAESLRSAGDARRPMWAEAIGAVVTLSLLPAAVARFGIEGAAAVSSLSYLVSFAWNLRSLMRKPAPVAAA